MTVETPSTGNDAGPPIEPPYKKMRVSDLLGVSQAPVPPDQNKTLLTTSGEWTAAEAITKAIPKDQGVPLTILTGFLGAGKSTVLNYILKAEHGLKIAVLINEFGQVDIDNQLVESVGKGEEGEPIMLNNGCVCCTISSGFEDAVRRTLEEADARGRIPDYFIVETTGLADPKPIVDTVSMTELREEVYVDQILTVVDASAWTDKHYDSDTAMKQIEAADTILLSKTDLADSNRVQQVVQSILDVRPNARILRSQQGYVPIAALFDLGMSMSASTRNTKVSSTNLPPQSDGNKANNTHAHAHEHTHSHTHQHGEKCGDSCSHRQQEQEQEGQDKKPKNHLEEEGFSSVSFVSEFPLSMRRFKCDFMDQLPQGVFRAKGLLWFAGDPNRFIFHWSGQRFQAEEQDWPEGIKRNNQLVVIGRQLDRADIASLLEKCVVKPGEESEDDIDEEEYAEEDEDKEGLVEGDEGEDGDEEDEYEIANAVDETEEENGIEGTEENGAAQNPVAPQPQSKNA